MHPDGDSIFAQKIAKLVAGGGEVPLVSSLEQLAQKGFLRMDYDNLQFSLDTP